jgi:hypothetical protein
LNEPGITKAHRDYDAYNAIITYKNIEVAVFKMLASVAEPSVYMTKDDEPSVYATKDDESKVVCECACLKTNDKEFAMFGDIMRKHFLKNKEKIRERVLATQSSAIEYTINVYKMTVLADYKMLLEKFD